MTSVITPISPVNRLLRPLNLSLGWIDRRPRGPREFKEAFERDLATLQRDPQGWDIIRDPWYETGDHPALYADHESEFVSKHLPRIAPRNVLDIGSYRLFVLGLLAGYPVTTIDVRPRVSRLKNETVITCDAKELTLPDGSFDAVTSLCAIEHFGLGRYGDAFDRQADEKGLAEMRRVLRPGGRLILSTTITRAPKAIAFNGARIYDLDHIRRWTRGFEVEDEAYFSHAKGGYCSYDDVTRAREKWDVYMGCWRKI